MLYTRVEKVAHNCTTESNVVYDAYFNLLFQEGDIFHAELIAISIQQSFKYFTVDPRGDPLDFLIVCSINNPLKNWQIFQSLQKRNLLNLLSDNITTRI